MASMPSPNRPPPHRHGPGAHSPGISSHPQLVSYARVTQHQDHVGATARIPPSQSNDEANYASSAAFNVGSTALNLCSAAPCLYTATPVVNPIASSTTKPEVATVSNCTASPAVTTGQFPARRNQRRPPVGGEYTQSPPLDVQPDLDRQTVRYVSRALCA